MKNFLMIVLLLANSVVLAKEATDMIGRNVKIPENSSKVFSASPPMSILLYMLAPKKMIGLNYKLMPTERTYMLKEVQDLPTLGSFFSSGSQANFEKVVALKPDIVFMWDITRKNAGFFEKELEKLQIPLVYIQQNTIAQTKDALQNMAKFIGKEQRANELIEYADFNINRVKESVKKLKEPRKKVFMAGGADGLRTFCDKDIHAEIISFTGGENVYKCDNNEPKKANITLEQLYKYDPDVIFVWNPTFFKSLDKNSPWRNLRAYKNKQIYFTPMSPFSWLIRPVSMMRLLGIVWMHYKLYPEHFNIDENKEIKDFYKLFLHVNLSDEDVQNVLKGK